MKISVEILSRKCCLLEKNNKVNNCVAHSAAFTRSNPWT